MHRLLALLLALALLGPVPGALAQGGGAFGPLPPAQPAETPPPDPEDVGGTDDRLSRETMFLVALGVVLVFFVIGWAITRDARRSLTDADREALEGMRAPGSAPRKQDRAKLKQKARQKTRAQKRARRKTRR